MNLQQTLKNAANKLNHLENPKLETEVLLAALIKKNRTWLKTHPDFELSDDAHKQFNEWAQKRSAHVPTAYIIGEVEWNGLKLKVTPDTLIPRDETETLCHHTKQQTLVTPASILDIGTGTGCIACWAKTNFPQASVTALDYSEPALKVAKANAQKLKLAITFLHSDLLSGLVPHSNFDLIVANLPYVPEGLKVAAEVKAEPHNAIFSGDDGLNHIKRLKTELNAKQIRFKQLWLEFLPSQAKAIGQIFSDYEVLFFKAINEEIFFAQIKPLV